MADLIFKNPEDIHLKIMTYNNCDDVQICWRSLANDGKDYPIFGCLGFIIERQRQKNGQWQEIEVLRNRVGLLNNLLMKMTLNLFQNRHLYGRFRDMIRLIMVL